jgi:murein DD-endopeptidase MepM/ murein hydrolase activator NlpD
LPRSRHAPRPPSAARQPRILVAILVVGSIAAYALDVEPIGARVLSTPAPIEAEAVRAVPVPPSEAPARDVALGARPRQPIDVEPAPTPQPPAVVRFRPRDGWTGVARSAAVSVRFTEPMDRSAERAFAASLDGEPITGSYRWAENDTVLVLQPAAALPYGAKIQLNVVAGALSQAGGALPSSESVTFTVQERPAPAPKTPPTSKPAPTSRPASTGWQWPLLGPITQRFGESLTQYGTHQGIDIDGDTGDPVRAARDGAVVVASSNWDECGGLQIHLDHGNGIESWYRHLSRIDVAVGRPVVAGTIIGAVGDTGCSLGSHLHFGIRDGKVFVDPLRYLPPR